VRGAWDGRGRRGAGVRRRARRARGGAALAKQILAEETGVRRVLWPCARQARREVPEILSAAGCEVLEVPVYAMVPVPTFAARVAAAPSPAAVVLGSPRAVDALQGALGAASRDLPAGVPLAVLGSVTAKRAAATFEGYVAQASSKDGAGLARAVSEGWARTNDERA